MRDQLVLFSTHEKAKEKGFKKMFNLTTQTALQKWFRDKHNLIIQVNYEEVLSISCDILPQLKILRLDNEFGKCANILPYELRGVDYDTYELALEKGLEIALKYI